MTTLDNLGPENNDIKGNIEHPNLGKYVNTDLWFVTSKYILPGNKYEYKKRLTERYSVRVNLQFAWCYYLNGTSTLFPSSFHEMYNCTKHHTWSVVARVTKNNTVRPHLPATVPDRSSPGLPRTTLFDLIFRRQWKIN